VTPREYIEVVRERWRSIVAGLLLGLLVGGALIYLVPPRYSTAVTVLVAAQSNNVGGTTSDTGEISSQRLSTYVELLGSKRLASGVISDLGLPTTPGELANRITVTTTPDSLLLTATVTDASPGQVIRIANDLADQFIKNVAEIEQPSDPTRQPAVIAKTFEQAQPPAQQVAPRPVLYLALGAVVGLLLGFAAALLRHALDFRVKSRRQVEEALGVPVLGTIGRDPKIPSSPLVMYGAPYTPLAEAFRQLRTNVQFVDVDRRHKVILVTSATSGEGRSTTVCNLGLALAEAGQRVLIVDADLRSPSIERILGVDGPTGLTDVLVNRISVERALLAIAPTLDVLPSGLLPPNPSELLGSNRMVNLLAALRGKYDVVLVDSAPLIPVTDAAVLAPRVDGVLVLVRHGRTVVKDLQAAKEALDAVSARVLGAVMTMVPHVSTRSHARLKPRRGRPPVVLGHVPAEPRDADPRDADPRGEARATGPGPTPRQQDAGPRPAESAEADGQVLDRGGSAAR
jgi:capsular exopolysaccharide synthesis family protein